MLVFVIVFIQWADVVEHTHGTHKSALIVGSDPVDELEKNTNLWHSFGELAP